MRVVVPRVLEQLDERFTVGRGRTDDFLASRLAASEDIGHPFAQRPAAGLTSPSIVVGLHGLREDEEAHVEIDVRVVPNPEEEVEGGPQPRLPRKPVRRLRKDDPENTMVGCSVSRSPISSSSWTPPRSSVP